MGIPHAVKALLGHDRHAKFDGVEHHVRGAGIQSAVIRQGNQSGNTQGLLPHRQRIPHGQAVVVRIHPVNGDLIRPLRQCTLHQANLIHLFPIDKDPQGAVHLGGFTLQVEIRVHRQLLPVQPLQQRIICLGIQLKVAILNVVFVKAFIVGNDHAPVGNQKAGHNGNHTRQEQKQHKVLANLAFQLPGQPLVQRIFHQTPSLPF